MTSVGDKPAAWWARDREVSWQALSRAGWPVAWLAGLGLAVARFHALLSSGLLGADAHAYWLIGQPGATLYSAPPGHIDAFLYSPAFAQAVSLVNWLPWPVFVALWMVLETSAFAWLLAPLGWRWSVPLLLLCAMEISLGNIVGFLAIAAVLGARRPVTWTAFALTKPSLTLGPVWFLVRRDWWSLCWILSTTSVVTGVSFLVDPDGWIQWFRFLHAHAGSSPTLLARFIFAATLTAVGAWTGRAWLLAPALIITTPILAGVAWLTWLCVLPRLLLEAPATRRRSYGPGPPPNEQSTRERLRRCLPRK